MQRTLPLDLRQRQRQPRQKTHSAWPGQTPQDRAAVMRDADMNLCEQRRIKPPCTAPTVRAFCFNPLIAPRSKTSVKYSKGKFKMTREEMVLEARLCPWLRFCIGAAMLFLAATPLIYVARWW